MASMSREEFLSALEKRLKGIPKEERQEAMNYYSEYLEDGSVEELGSVEEVARQVLDECVIKSMDSEEKSGSLKALWIVVLAVFAAPVAIPVAVALGVVVLALLICVGAVVLSVAVSGAAFVLGGVYAAAVGIIILPHSLVNMLMTIGMGLVLIGGGLLILIGIFYASRFLIRVFVRQLGRLVRRGK